MTTLGCCGEIRVDRAGLGLLGGPRRRLRHAPLFTAAARGAVRSRALPLLGNIRGLHRALPCASARRCRGVSSSTLQPTLNVPACNGMCGALPNSRRAPLSTPSRLRGASAAGTRALRRNFRGEPSSSRAINHDPSRRPRARLGPHAATHPQSTLAFTSIVHTARARAWRAGGLRRRHDISPLPIHSPAACGKWGPRIWPVRGWSGPVPVRANLHTTSPVCGAVNEGWHGRLKSDGLAVSAHTLHDGLLLCPSGTPHK